MAALRPPVLATLPASGSIAVHRVDAYEPVYQARTVVQPLHVEALGVNLSFAAGAPIVVLRSFRLDDADVLLIVDATNLQTAVVERETLEQTTREATGAEANVSHYASLLDTHGLQPFDCIDIARISPTHLRPRAMSPSLSTCANRTGLGTKIFSKASWLVLMRMGVATPIGIAITGLWAERHASELAQLIEWQSAGKLAITWINHSYSHPVGADQSFLTNPKVDFTANVIDLERALLEHGQTPLCVSSFSGPGA